MARKLRLQYEGAIKGQLRPLGWTQRDLAQSAKGDKRKIRIAKLLPAQTTMTLKWIAHRLHMGVWTHLSNRLYHVKV
jgi:hypothetical protein